MTCGHKDKDGYYCIWGTHGAHYHYTKGDKESMARARAKAGRQGRAIQVNKKISNQCFDSELLKSIQSSLDKASDILKRINNNV